MAIESTIELVYDGPEVKDGTMSIDDMVSALIGFGRAYGKTAEYSNVQAHHSLRVTGLEQGSADIMLRVVEWSGENSDHLIAASKAVAATSTAILGTIAGVIKLKRFLQNKQASKLNITNNGVLIINEAG